MATEKHLDDQIKQAQLDKTLAEAEKLRREAEAASHQARTFAWSESLKILAGVVVGIGGAVAAYTQFEVAELRARVANQDLARAEQSKADAEALMKDAVAKRDAAMREQQEAEQAVKELKASLARTTSEIRRAKPGLVNARLAYIQFRGSMPRALINDLRVALEKDAFDAPGAERVSGDYQSMVKYFQPGDSQDAARLAKAVEQFFEKHGCPVSLRVVPATTANSASSPLEVWLSHSCG